MAALVHAVRCTASNSVRIFSRGFASRCQSSILPSLSFCQQQFAPVQLYKKSMISRNFMSFGLASKNLQSLCSKGQQRPLLAVPEVATQSVRTKVLGSMKGCKEKTVKAVVKRFYRLRSGLWIRTRAGRQKKLWQKRAVTKYRARQHVICNPRQTRLLNRMVTDFWKKPRHFVDDIYEPYHKRTGFYGDRVQLAKKFWP